MCEADSQQIGQQLTWTKCSGSYTTTARPVYPFLYQSLQAAGWSRKVCKKHAQQQSEALRGSFEAARLLWDGKKVCTVDESASNERTSDRKKGWSPQGIPARDIHSLRRSERWSVLPAMTSTSWLANPLITQGSVNRELFVEWLNEHVLPFLGPDWILLMDNASIHYGKEVQELVASYGVSLVYLPPYSPDYNPIESSFHVLKQWIKTHQLEIDMFPDFGAFLVWAVGEIGGRYAREHFIAAGYRC